MQKKMMVEEHEQLSRMRQDFVANVSHELRTPLTVIHGYVESLIARYGQTDEVLSEVLISMQQQTLRMETLISDLLLLSQIENESPQAKKHPISLSALMQDLQNDVRSLSTQHQMSWVLDSSVELLGHADELHSAFSNLITNAIRYTKPEGLIEVQVGMTDLQEIFFQVKDTGVGIESSHIPRLTERFYRVDKGRSRKSGGTGLGLAIVKHVLLRHDAVLDIESEVGVGSVFRCTFPKERSIRLP